MLTKQTLLGLGFIVLSSLVLLSSCEEDCDINCPEGQIIDINCNCIVIDPCVDINCTAGEILTADCDCIPDSNVNPCEGVTCEEGLVLTADCDCVEPSENLVTKAGFIGTETWTKDKIYVLVGKVVVPSGECLTIEAGTVIKGDTGTGTLASALVVARNAQIKANGTAENPIIFTSIEDEIVSGQIMSPNLTQFDNQLWGGLIILGNAPISAKDGDTVGQIEGISADDTFGTYGGDNPQDNSGVLRYISVRHGGAIIGGDNEINGITFGGVGNETIVENIEVIANKDDGVEWFGGTVNCRNVIVANGEDDGLDIDQNYSGIINNAVVIQSGETEGDNAIEIDGPEGSTYVDGTFRIENFTAIDEDGASDAAGHLKSLAQGEIINASWRGFSDNILVDHSCEEDCSTYKSDAYTNYIAGKLNISNSEWVGVGTITDWITVLGDDDCADGSNCEVTEEMRTELVNILENNSNIISSQGLRGADLSAFNNWSWAYYSGKLN